MADFGAEVGRVLKAGSLVQFDGEAAQAVEVRVLTVGAGQLVTTEGRSGQGAAVRFPKKGGDATAIAVVPKGSDVLSPGKRRFTFGADFKADGYWGRDGSNLVQRGLFTDSSQYKIELDGGRPTCSIKGSAGEVTVRSSQLVQRDEWYSVGCARYEDSVALTLTRLRDSKEWMSVVSGKTGDVVADTPTEPFSVGAKVWPEPGLSKDPDQFYGVVDNVYLRFE